MKHFIALLIFAVTILPSFSQGYFANSEGEATPVGTAQGNASGLFQVKLNTSNSASIGIFNIITPSSKFPSTIDLRKTSPGIVNNYKSTMFGWGLSLTGKAENGIATLFNSNQFTPSASVSGYFAFDFFKIKTDPSNPGVRSLEERSDTIITKTFCKINDSCMIEVFDTSIIITPNTILVQRSKSIAKEWLIIPAIYLDVANHRLFNDAAARDAMKIDSTFVAPRFALSFQGILPFNGKYDDAGNYLGKLDDLLLGLTFDYGLRSNYSSLDMVEVRENRRITFTDTTSREVQNFDEDGYTYGVFKEYKKFNSLKVKANIGYIPSFLDNRIGFILYPTVEYADKDKPKYSAGFSANLLKKGSPLVTQVGVFFEFNDLTNYRDRDIPFFKRTFKAGIVASLNVLTNSK